MRSLLLFGLFSLFHPLYAQKGSADTLSSYYQKRINRYLDKENALSGYYSFKAKGISMYSSPSRKEKDSAEFFLPWTDLEGYRNLDVTNMVKFYNSGGSRSGYVITGGPVVIFADVPPDKPLTGKKIAIDPGHIGGTEEDAKLERKIVKPAVDSSISGPEVIEGNLTMQTALLLKKMLEEKGATVMLTREGEGKNAFGDNYDDWIRKNFRTAVNQAFKKGEIDEKEKKKLLNPKTNKEYVFRNFFLIEELKQRARKINLFRPDLTVSIHYNADETNKGWTKFSEKDLNMVFVAGSYMQDELKTKRDRCEFLRLLITEDIDHSIRAASFLIKEFSERLKVAPAGKNDALYLNANCITLPTKGIFCRNLELTRYVHGALIYGVSLYQDNSTEFNLLCSHDLRINGVMTCIRVKQVADSYLEAVLAYFK